MIGLTFSVKMNKAATNIPHNNRQLTEEEYKQPAHEHIIREKSSDNIVIRQSTIQEAYKEVFGEAVEEYNAKQKRKDRNRKKKNGRKHRRRSGRKQKKKKLKRKRNGKKKRENLPKRKRHGLRRSENGGIISGTGFCRKSGRCRRKNQKTEDD